MNFLNKWHVSLYKAEHVLKVALLSSDTLGRKERGRADSRSGEEKVELVEQEAPRGSEGMCVAQLLVWMASEVLMYWRQRSTSSWPRSRLWTFVPVS